MTFQNALILTYAWTRWRYWFVQNGNYIHATSLSMIQSIDKYISACPRNIERDCIIYAQCRCFLCALSLSTRCIQVNQIYHNISYQSSTLKYYSGNRSSCPMKCDRWQGQDYALQLNGISTSKECSINLEQAWLMANTSKECSINLEQAWLMANANRTIRNIWYLIHLICKYYYLNCPFHVKKVKAQILLGNFIFAQKFSRKHFVQYTIPLTISSLLPWQALLL